MILYWCCCTKMYTITTKFLPLELLKKISPKKKERKKRQIIQVISGCYSLFASIVIWELFNN